MTFYNSNNRSKNIENTKIKPRILHGNTNNSNNFDKSNSKNSYKNNKNVIITIKMT